MKSLSIFKAGCAKPIDVASIVDRPALVVPAGRDAPDTRAALPIPKVMEYQLADGRTCVSFVRPAHRLVVLHGEQVVPASVLGLSAGRVTFGHRFQSAGELSIPDASAWAHVLERQGRVIPDFDTRRARILALLQAQARALDSPLPRSEGAT